MSTWNIWSRFSWAEIKRKKIWNSPGLSLYLSKQNGLLTHGFKWKTFSWSMFWNFPSSRILENKNNLSISGKIVFKAACLIFVTHYVTIFQFTTYVRTIYYNNFSSFCCWEMNGSLRVHFCLFVLNNEFINTFIKGLESGQSILKIHAWIIFLYWLSSQTVNISIANNSSTGLFSLNKYFLHLHLKQLLLESKPLESW